MQRVIAPPLQKGRQCEHAGRESHRVVQAVRDKERSVRAITHDDERAHQPAGRRHPEQQRERERVRQNDVDSPHQCRERQERRDELKRRAPRVRADERLDCAAPIRSREGSDWLAQRLPNFVTFSAAGPFCPCTMSNSTRSPSVSDLNPPP